MNIVKYGQKKPKHAWTGRYSCARCNSVIELTDDDSAAVQKVHNSQREGYSIQVMCPVCEEVRWMSECDALTDRCGGLGTRGRIRATCGNARDCEGME